MCRMNHFISVEKVLEDIPMRYTHVGSANRLLAELKVIKQESRESVGSYGQRVEILLNRLLNTYDADRSLQDFKKFTYKKRGDSEAHKQFLYGLQGDLQHQVRAANPKTLVEAITDAVRNVQKTGTRRVGTQSGHISTDQEGWDPDNRRNNRDSRINWRPEYRDDNYRNQGGRGNRTRYRPYVDVFPFDVLGICCAVDELGLSNANFEVIEVVVFDAATLVISSKIFLFIFTELSI